MKELKVLFIDNYDSFTYNLEHLFYKVSNKIDIKIIKNDVVLENFAKKISQCDAIVISPGPSSPLEAGISTLVIRNYYKTKPILGVCLGMQCIANAFGYKVLKAPYPIHGQTSTCCHDGNDLFEGMANHFKIARYHSLCVEDKAAEKFHINAKSEDGVIQAISHKKYPLYGLQYHPESFMSEFGAQNVENFIQRVGFK